MNSLCGITVWWWMSVRSLSLLSSLIIQYHLLDVENIVQQGTDVKYQGSVVSFIVFDAGSVFMMHIL